MGLDDGAVFTGLFLERRQGVPGVRPRVFDAAQLLWNPVDINPVFGVLPAAAVDEVDMATADARGNADSLQDVFGGRGRRRHEAESTLCRAVPRPEQLQPGRNEADMQNHLVFVAHGAEKR